MKTWIDISMLWQRSAMVALSCGLVIICAGAQETDETRERMRIAAANMEDALVVDCQLPGKLRRLGGTRNYLTPGRLIRASAIVCRTRGGEYTLGDLASGTLSLQRWLVPANDGDAEAQYYVARIYANGMDNVEIDYGDAARWYRQAADQGFAEAKQELGYLYERGLGVEKDELKALNLQREASGLGDDLDYAYKIDDANALLEGLTNQLNAANNALHDSQLELANMQSRLIAARGNARQQETQIAALVADLDEAKRVAANASSPRVELLEKELANVSAQLVDSHAAALSLEGDRDAAKTALALQMAGGQATQLELRELLGRAELAEQSVESLTADLAQARQRLIHSDREIQLLRSEFQEKSDQVATERARMLEARSRSESDASAYLASLEVEMISRTARINGLQKRVDVLKSKLEGSREDSADAARVRQELATLQARYDSDIAALQDDRDRLTRSNSASSDELIAMYAASKQRLAERDVELGARKREIDTLAQESERLRARVAQLDLKNIDQAQKSDLRSARMQADLYSARQQVAKLHRSLDAAQSEKSAMEAKLLKNKLELQEQMATASESSTVELDLLRAEVSVAERTINLQSLRIAALEEKTKKGIAQLVSLKKEAVAVGPSVVETQKAMAATHVELRKEADTVGNAIGESQKAMAVLHMAQSRDEEPDLGVFHALIIANQEYVNMPPLTTPIRDAREIEQLLIGRYGFEVQVLTDATDDMIMRALHEYSNRLTAEDNLLIYYAGRGSTPDGPPDRAYWLGVDADPELRNTWLLSEHISDKIKQMDARRILVVTDSCFSRRRVQPKSAALGRGVDPNIFKLLASLKSRVVLTSGANVPLYDEKGDRTHSLFAKYFMEILRQNENVLSGEMLSYELGYRVRENSENPDRFTPSYTSLQDAGHRGGDFFFVPVQQSTRVASL